LSRTVLEGDADRRSVRRAERDPARPGLLAIARRLRVGLDEAFRSFAEGWSGDAADAFWADAERAIASLHAHGGLPREIERKYLLSGLPDDLKKTRPLEIEQGYLPGKHLQERLRRVKEQGATMF